MGWAKYQEDIESIINNRIPFTYDNVDEKKQGQLYALEKEYIEPLSTQKNKRAELEIYFFKCVDNTLYRKLQMNGWWWSKLNNCWCNYNTAINRNFAETIKFAAGKMIKTIV